MPRSRLEAPFWGPVGSVTDRGQVSAPVLVAPLPPELGTRTDSWVLSYQQLIPSSPVCGSYTRAELFVSTPTALQISRVSMRYQRIKLGSFLDYLRNTDLKVGIVGNRV